MYSWEEQVATVARCLKMKDELPNGSAMSDAAWVKEILHFDHFKAAALSQEVRTQQAFAARKARG